MIIPKSYRRQMEQLCWRVTALKMAGKSIFSLYPIKQKRTICIQRYDWVYILENSRNTRVQISQRWASQRPSHFDTCRNHIRLFGLLLMHGCSIMFTLLTYIADIPHVQTLEFLFIERMKIPTLDGCNQAINQAVIEYIRTNKSSTRSTLYI